jgi:hypothetical protein
MVRFAASDSFVFDPHFHHLHQHGHLQIMIEALLHAVVLDTGGIFAMLICYQPLQACLAYDRQSGAELDLMLIGDCGCADILLYEFKPG